MEPRRARTSQQGQRERERERRKGAIKECRSWKPSGCLCSSGRLPRGACWGGAAWEERRRRVCASGGATHKRGGAAAAWQGRASREAPGLKMGSRPTKWSREPIAWLLPRLRSTRVVIEPRRERHCVLAFCVWARHSSRCRPLSPPAPNRCFRPLRWRHSSRAASKAAARKPPARSRHRKGPGGNLLSATRARLSSAHQESNDSGVGVSRARGGRGRTEPAGRTCVLRDKSKMIFLRSNTQKLVIILLANGAHLQGDSRTFGQRRSAVAAVRDCRQRCQMESGY